MTTLEEIKKAVSAELKKRYPDYEVYGVDTVDGYERPSFFVYVTQTFSESTKNVMHKNVEVEIDFVQKVTNEVEAMKFFETMERVFGQKLKTENRHLTTSNLSTGFDGENKNLPYFIFEIEFWSAIEKEKDEAPMMGEVNIEQEVKRWDYR